MYNHTKQLLLPLTALLTCLAGIPAQADAVDANNITSFTAGTPARAAEVNSTIAELTSAINDNDQRIASLLSMPDAPPAQNLSIDCNTDAASLNNAIAGASRETSLNISVSGNCSAVSIDRDYVTINGGTSGATITSTVEGTPALRVSQARSINLENLTLGGDNIAEVGLQVTSNSAVSAANLTVSGVTSDAVTVILNSVLQLNGDNTITGGSAQGLFAAGTSTVYINDGTTTVTSDDCSMDVVLNGVIISEGTLNASGSCLNIERGQVLIERGIVNTGTATITGELILDSRGTGNTVALNHSGRVLVFSGGSFSLIGREGGVATIDATTDDAHLAVTGNANANFLLLDGGDGSQVKTTGDLLVLDGYLIASGGESSGFDGQIELGTSGDLLRVEGARVVVFGNAANNNVSHFGFGQTTLHLAAHMVIAGAAAVSADSNFVVGRNSELRAFGDVGLANSAGVACEGDGFAFSLIGSDFTNHCL